MTDPSKPFYLPREQAKDTEHKNVDITRCEAYNAVIPDENLWPKPRCRMCGWVWSCCNPV